MGGRFYEPPRMVSYRFLPIEDHSFFVLIGGNSMYTFFLEAFGYLGTALVLFSMMMTSLKWLRIFNVMGSVISMIYAALVGTVPVVLLNLGMILINLAQLLREKRKQTAESKEHPETENGSDT